MSFPSSSSQPNSKISRSLSRTTSRTPVGRPSSSLSVRPSSSAAATRPQSRFSQPRPHSRQARSRLIPICHTLVTHITGLKADGSENDPEGEMFREKVDYAVRNLETTTTVKATPSVDMGGIDRQISGHALKARVNSKDDLGKALEVAYRQLKTHIETQQADLDNDIKTAHLPDHMQFLLALSRPPSRVTEAMASSYLDSLANPLPPPAALTWADILAEEPFEGEHWEGIHFPGRTPSNYKTGYESGGDSEPSLSPLNSDDLALDDESDSLSSADFDELFRPDRTQTVESGDERHTPPEKPYPLEHRKQFEGLQSMQYWREDWQTDAALYSPFDLGDPSTLGPTLNRVLAAGGFQDALAMLKPERYINEEDMVREVLMALQGNRNIILTWSEGSFKTTPKTPRLIHLSLASQESIICSLAKTATTVEHLRRFTAGVFSLSLSISRSTITPADGRQTYISKKTPITRTCEAFADGIDHTIRGLNSWCAAREEAMCRAHAGIDEEPVIVSLLHTEKALRDNYAASFDVLLDIVRVVFQIAPEDSTDSFGCILERNRQLPTAQTALLLDTLFAAVQQHMERRDSVASDILMNVFVRAAEPVWGMVGRWLKDGMGLGLGLATASRGASSWGEQDDEFFIERSGLGFGMMGLGLLDPEFWSEGYALREISSSIDGPIGRVSDSCETKKVIPLFLQEIAGLVLGTGKAVGLMRALDTHTSFNAFEKWGSFSDLIVSEFGSATSTFEGKDTGLLSVSYDGLSRSVYDSLSLQCQVVGEKLVQVLVGDCALWKHLEAIENLYLMRKGDAMSHFVDIVFAKMDSQQPWSDFHFLNTAFNDVFNSNANVGAKDWINPSLVRLSYRAGREKDQTIKRTIKAIDGLVLEYSVPFPLIYIFQPKGLKEYNDVFNFLLQIRRAKSMLERILVRDVRGRSKGLKDELKVFYAMRSRLSWFINTLLNFLTTYVIHAEVARFHQVLRNARSLDEMIQLHDEHLGKIRGRCLLKPNTAALHRTILSILDMCLHFSEGFVTFAGDTTATLDVSRQSLNLKRHRSRRQQRQRRNVIGFSQFLQGDILSSDDEDEEDVDSERVMEPSVSMLGNSTMDTEGDFFSRVEKMSSELDGLIRFLRRGVESLAGGTSDAASAYGVLAFALEDWDI